MRSVTLRGGAVLQRLGRTFKRARGGSAWTVWCGLEKREEKEWMEEVGGRCGAVEETIAGRARDEARMESGLLV